jgi:hypothetical protein
MNKGLITGKTYAELFRMYWDVSPKTEKGRATLAVLIQDIYYICDNTPDALKQKSI